MGLAVPFQVFLTPPEPLQRPPELPLAPSAYLEPMRALRIDFTRLLLAKMRAPDGSYEDGFIVPGTNSPPQRPNRAASNLEQNNPLSLHDEVCHFPR